MADSGREYEVRLPRRKSILTSFEHGFRKYFFGGDSSSVRNWLVITALGVLGILLFSIFGAPLLLPGLFFSLFVFIHVGVVGAMVSAVVSAIHWRISAILSFWEQQKRIPTFKDYLLLFLSEIPNGIRNNQLNVFCMSVIALASLGFFAGIIGLPIVYCIGFGFVGIMLIDTLCRIGNFVLDKFSKVEGPNVHIPDEGNRRRALVDVEALARGAEQELDQFAGPPVKALSKSSDQPILSQPQKDIFNVEMKSGSIYRFGMKEPGTGGRKVVDVTGGLGNFHRVHIPNEHYGKSWKPPKREDMYTTDENGGRVINWDASLLPPAQMDVLPPQVNATVKCQCADSKYVLIVRDIVSDEVYVLNVSKTQDDGVCAQFFRNFGSHYPQKGDARPQGDNKFDILYIPVGRSHNTSTILFNTYSADLGIPQKNINSFNRSQLSLASKSMVEICFDIEKNALDVKYNEGTRRREKWVQRCDVFTGENSHTYNTLDPT